MKIVENRHNLIPNLSKIKQQHEVLTVPTINVDSKSRFNISSYKDEYKFISNKRTKEDYQRIKEEMGFTELTIEDMIWIDENVHEDPTVHS
jgi:predicted RNA-binding protein with RPS1 domain